MSSAQPLVTIVTPSFNQGKFIERTILSVIKQDYPRIEYILLDSLSTDDTNHVLSKFAPQITRVIRAKDHGQSDAVNKGFAMSNGSIMAYLNSDDCYANAGVVSRAVKALTADSTTDLVYGRRRLIDEDGMYIRTDPYREFDRETLFRTCYIAQEACFWTRNIYDKSGGYVCDENRFALDYEMWLRFLKHGANFQAVKDVYGLFRMHPAAKTSNAWLDVGFYEARDAQLKYSGRGSSLTEMYAVAYQYIHGINAAKYPSAALLNESLLLRQALFGQTLFRAPMDHWVYQDFTNLQIPLADAQ